MQERAKAMVGEGGDTAIKPALTRAFEFYRGGLGQVSSALSNTRDPMTFCWATGSWWNRCSYWAMAAAARRPRPWPRWELAEEPSVSL